jgi:hypothetical protein
VTHPGRTVTAGSVEFEEAAQPHAPTRCSVQSPMSKVQSPKSKVATCRTDFGRWTFSFGLRAARDPGIGLLNRTSTKSWVERHEVQFLRGLPTQNQSPKIKDQFGLCSSNGLEQASHKREVGGSTPPTATKGISDCRLPIADSRSGQTRSFRFKSNRQLEIGNRQRFRAGDVTDSIEVLQTSCEGLNPSQSTKSSGDVAQLDIRASVL